MEVLTFVVEVILVMRRKNCVYLSIGIITDIVRVSISLYTLQSEHSYVMDYDIGLSCGDYDDGYNAGTCSSQYDVHTGLSGFLRP